MQSASTNKSAKDTANSAELKVWHFVCVCVCVRARIYLRD